MLADQRSQRFARSSVGATIGQPSGSRSSARRGDEVRRGGGEVETTTSIPCWHEPDPGRDRRRGPSRLLARDDESPPLQARLGEHPLDALVPAGT